MTYLFSESDRLDNLYFHKNINNSLKELAKYDIHNINKQQMDRIELSPEAYEAPVLTITPHCYIF